MPTKRKTQTETAQTETAQTLYRKRQVARGYYQTRPWLPVELRDWHKLLVARARDAKEYGVPLDLPPPPPINPPK